MGFALRHGIRPQCGALYAAASEMDAHHVERMPTIGGSGSRTMSFPHICATVSSSFTIYCLPSTLPGTK